MLAKNLNDNADILNERVVLEFFASKNWASPSFLQFHRPSILCDRLPLDIKVNFKLSLRPPLLRS